MLVRTNGIKYTKLESTYTLWSMVRVFNQETVLINTENIENIQEEKAFLSDGEFLYDVKICIVRLSGNVRYILPCNIEDAIKLLELKIKEELMDVEAYFRNSRKQKRSKQCS